MAFTSLLKDFLGGGLAAALPSAAVLGPTIPPGSSAYYFATDSNALYRLAGGDVVWQLAAAGGGAGALTLIGSVTTAASQVSVSFNAIPNTYNHLEIRSHAASVDNNVGLQQATTVQFNGDAVAGNYSGTGQGLYGAGPTGFPAFNGMLIPSGNAAGAYFGRNIMRVHNYKDTVYGKTFDGSGMSWQQNVGVVSTTGSGAWTGIAAVTDILLKPNGGSAWKDGSKFWLYGIS